MNKECEVCDNGTTATYLVDRTWNDGDCKGALDLDLIVCNQHIESDPNGLWTMANLREIPNVQA